ncbi:MAG: hypothetical protein AAGG44_21375, partial [Planctomycetota bacterium]
MPAFRDGYHFYYPQVAWLHECALQGDFFPQWNRFDGLGASVPGQVSTALYYPGRLILLVPTWYPSISIEQAYSAYMAFHVILAAAGFRLACRILSAPQFGSLIGTCAFGLSASLVFQHCNLIYLCSASWLGFAAAGASMIILQRGRLVGVLLLAAALAAMVLAGDPHTAVNSYLVFGLTFLVAHIRDWATSPGWLRRVTTAGFSCLLPLVLVIGLTAIQWIPALRWAEHSSRSTLPTQPIIATADASPQVDLSDDHEFVRRVLSQLTLSRPLKYEFSLSPWHLGTAAWPLAGGFYLPENSRWFDALPAEGRTWVPTLFSGTIPLLVVLLSLKQRGPTRYLLVLMGIATYAAMGNYSLTWVLRELMSSLRLEDWAQRIPSDRSTAMYEAFNQLIPGYSNFRYPAKWLAIASLCFSFVVALNSDQALSKIQERLGRTHLAAALFVAVGSLLLLCFAAALKWSALGEWFEAQQSSDVLLGRCELGPAIEQLSFSALLPVFSLLA